MTILKRALRYAFLLLTPWLLSGCKYIILDPKGVIAADEKTILIVCVLLMLIVVIPVIFLTFFFTWRYREGNPHAKYDPEWSHNTAIEVVCWSIPILIIGTLATITWISSHRLDPFAPIENAKEKPIVIQAIALEWKWLFIYPEQNIATVNFVEFPVGVPVRFFITAEGPMNALQIPQLGGQIYAMAGMQSILNLQADEVGDYRGMSSQFSGEGFSDMIFTARVGTKEQFNDWVKEVKKAPGELTQEVYDKLVVPSAKYPVTYFSLGNQTLYETVVMKEMMPLNEARNLCNKRLMRS